MRLCSWTGLLPLYKAAGVPAANAIATIRNRILLHQNGSLPVAKHWQLTATCGPGLIDSAEGLLVVALGPATQPKKLLRAHRRYLINTLVDINAAEEQKKHVGHVTQDLIQSLLQDQFVGFLKQHPKGQRHSHEVQIHQADCTYMAFPNFSLVLNCSSATNVPSFVNDLAKALGTVLDIEKIVCDKNGEFQLEHALQEPDWQPKQVFDALQNYWNFWDNTLVSTKKRRAQLMAEKEKAERVRTEQWLKSKGYFLETYLARKESAAKKALSHSLPREEVGDALENKVRHVEHRDYQSIRVDQKLNVDGKLTRPPGSGEKMTVEESVKRALSRTDGSRAMEEAAVGEHRGFGSLKESVQQSLSESKPKLTEDSHSMREKTAVSHVLQNGHHHKTSVMKGGTGEEDQWSDSIEPASNLFSFNKQTIRVDDSQVPSSRRGSARRVRHQRNSVNENDGDGDVDDPELNFFDSVQSDMHKKRKDSLRRKKRRGNQGSVVFEDLSPSPKSKRQSKKMPGNIEWKSSFGL